MIKKKLLFLGCNYQQIPYLKEAKKLNFFLVGTDINKKAPGNKYLDKFYNISYEEPVELVKIGKKENFNSSDYVFTAASQFSHLGAAFFAKHFKINYLSLRTVNICLDKVKFYRLLTRLKVPVPKYFICQKKDKLERIINRTKNYYLKSDFSKNPLYVYYIKKGNVPNINFKKDRYLRNTYLLQEEAVGKHVRVNFNTKDFFYFVHLKGAFFSYQNHLSDFQYQIEISLKKIIRELYLTKRFVKFDLLVNKNQYYLIDIGIDPPSRLRVLLRYLKYNFDKNYFLQSIGKPYQAFSAVQLLKGKVLVSVKKVLKL